MRQLLSLSTCLWDILEPTCLESYLEKPPLVTAALAPWCCQAIDTYDIPPLKMNGVDGFSCVAFHGASCIYTVLHNHVFGS